MDAYCLHIWKTMSEGSGVKWSSIRAFATLTANNWFGDRAASMGAALSYYTVFSLGPILLVAINIAGWVWGRDATRDAVVGQIERLIGSDGAAAVTSILSGTSISGAGDGLLSSLLGLGLFLFTATAAFVQMQDDLNAIFPSERRSSSGILTFLSQRLLSVAMLIALGFIMLVSLLLDAALASATEYLGFDTVELAYVVLNTVVSWFLAIAVFALIYKVLPTRLMRWKPVLWGALCAGTLFILGKFLIGLYIGRADVASVFGAAGSLVTILLWVYYSAQILFLGAEVTKTLSSEIALAEYSDNR
jgi:membrane protein